MTKTQPQITREAWLQHAADVIRQAVHENGVAVPPVQVSCSWPGGGSAKKRIGECWPRKASKANVNEIFISPKIADSAKAVSILAHELVHAVDDCVNSHRAGFTKLGRQMGLEGKPTQMQPPEALAAKWAEKVTREFGPYPHRVLDKAASPTKPQVSRQKKVECGDCGAIFRMSRTVIESAEHGLSCPVCQSRDVAIESKD